MQMLDRGPHRMIVVLALASLGACAKASAPAVEPIVTRPVVRVPEPSPEPPPPQPEPEPEPVRIEGYEQVAEVLAAEWLPWWRADFRIAVARRGPVRLRPEGDALGLADRDPWPYARRLAVIEDAQRPRIVVDEGDVRLLLYVERQDAQPVLMTRARLRPEPSFTFQDPPQRGHVVVEHGTWVDVVSEDGDATQVRWQGGDETWTGWVDAEAVGSTAARPEPSPQADDERVLLTRRPTTLRVRPGGAGLTELDADDTVIALTDAASKGYRLVEFTRPCQDEVSYVGFVRSRDLFKPDYGMGHGCGSGSGRPGVLWGDARDAPRVPIEAGRFLIEPDGLRVVGCLRRPSELADLGDGVLAVATSWGPVPVRLAPEGLAGECGTRK